MVSTWAQFRLLLWKGYLIRRRSVAWTLVEIAIPVVLFVFITAVRTRNFYVMSPECHYDAKAFPSAGLLPFLHSLFCSYSNKCHQLPTTDDDKMMINEPGGKESIVIKTTRAFVLLLREMGASPQLFLEGFEEIGRIVRDLVGDRRVPLREFFNSSEQMYSFLGKAFQLDNEKMAELEGAYVTPVFFAYAIKEMQRVSALSQNPLNLLMTSDSNIAFLCNRSMLDASLERADGQPLSFALCASRFDVYSAAEHDPTLASSFQAKMKAVVNDSIDSFQKTYSDRSALLFSKFASANWDPIVDVLEELLSLNKTTFLQELFCGNFEDPFEKATAGATEEISEFADLKYKMTKFIQNITPAGGDSKPGSCGDIPLKSKYSCPLMRAAVAPQLKPLLVGKILVSPNVPVMMNLLKDTVGDFTLVSRGLQDALAKSDFAKAAKILLNIYDVKPSLLPPEVKRWMEKMKPLLEHWFNDAGDPDAFFVTLGRLANFTTTFSECIDFDRFVVVKDEETMENQALCLSSSDQYLSGIVFRNLSEDASQFPPVVWYKIRHLSTIVDSTDGIYASRRVVLSRDKPRIDLKYLTFGFSFIQDAVERAIIESRTKTTVTTGLYAQQEPYPCVSYDTFNISLFLGLFVLLSWMIPSALLVKNIVYEKEMRLKEMMRIMGLGDAIHWVVWAFQAFLFNVISIVIISLLLKYGNILPETDLSLLILLLVLFALCCICQCLLISTLFTRTNVASVASALLCFLFFFPYQLSVKSKSPTFTFITLLFPQTSMGYGFLMLAEADSDGQATWDYVGDMYLEDYGIALTTVLYSFLVDSAIFLLLAWYISAVFPGVYGVSQPWYFFVTKRYWCSTAKSYSDDGSSGDCAEGGDTVSTSDTAFEQEPSNLKLAVSIKDMTKVYPNKTKALDSLSVRFYESQITAFLGHNGAGKTTTMSILTGLYRPSSGKCAIYGMDLRSGMTAIRSCLGVCPQHNILFDKLSVKEQLEFYGALKGLTGAQLKSEVAAMLSDIGMAEKKDSLAAALSGGMKRKLCIGIALIAGSKLIILDEPTAGIDAHARRSIWKLLLKYKQDRTMILSTHHMDEADVLADRIAIISEGRLRASGSSLFMKKRFGEGNRLVISKEPKYIQSDPTSSAAESIAEEAESSELREVRPPPNFYNKLIQFVGEESRGKAVFVEDFGPELVFRLPIEMCAADMKNLFEALEERKNEFGVRGYGISAPSLQQIFLKVAPVDEIKLHKTEKSGISAFVDKVQNCFRKSNPAVGLIAPDSSPDFVGLVKGDQLNCGDDILNHPSVELITSTPRLRTRQIRALVTKRFITSKRSWLSLFAELCLPIALLIAMEVYKMVTSPQTYSEAMSIDEMSLPLMNVLYGNGTRSYVGVWNNASVGMTYLDSMIENPGVGTRCIDPSPLPEFASAQCVPGFANGSLDFAIDANATYTVPGIDCECGIGHAWNCSAAEYPMEGLQKLVMNTTDVLWDLTNRNISQFRLTGYDWTLDSEEVTLGGWTFGHENAQTLDDAGIANAQSGIGVLLDGLRIAANFTGFDWESATEGANWTAPRDPFNPPGMSFPDLLSAAIPSLDTRENQKVWFNNRAWISLPLLTNSFYNGVYRSLLSPEVPPESVGIIASNHPMNHTIDSAFESNARALQKMVVFRILVLNLILSLIPASFAMMLVDERTSFSKHLQSVSGIPQWAYWVVNFGYDYMTYVACSVVIMVCYYVLQVPMVISSLASFVALFFLLILYGVTAILLVYILQLFFTVPALAFVMIGIGMFFIGTVTTLAVLIIEKLMVTDPTLEIAHTICALVFLIVPQYNLGIAVLRLNMVYQVVDMGKTYLTGIGRADLIPEMPVPDPTEWRLMGKHFVCLAVLALIYALVIFFLEYRLLVFAIFRKMEKARTKRLVAKKAESQTILDDDVLSEQTKVGLIEKQELYGLVVKNLAKSYSSKFLAVNDISFAVERGECFGLLGVNGAGKTTTFSMLTGKLPIGLGEAYIQGERIEDHNLSSFRLFGYCPQFDALNLKLSAREQLEFYSRIRGIPEQQLQEVVSWAIREMQLTPYADEMASSYSGGNKRKLSAAIALVADPPVILLDEPSAGMDPSSQQFMWNLIMQLRRAKRTTILTSHSMEECEALCTRIAIMVDGQFECLGGLQHLKNKFGKGYTLTTKLHSIDDIKKAKEFIQNDLPSAHFEAAHCTTLFYRIDSAQCTIADVFGIVSKLQEKVAVDDYSLSQTTLDEVFVSFASKTGEAQTPGSTPQDSPKDPGNTAEQLSQLDPEKV
ncbi:hypothetical protein QR680_009797 [Steinernema hermaphroditum]|uniref:ABC transporter domain-containing protein n=1 Tax=Steinernema hermaphroditum TaxID=289476 RepID=A0AA39MA38_9BILA|nr:hypothetical protein QR680_009797 [Steinernema hermaphroditum]